jgi:hypothetical protein
LDYNIYAKGQFCIPNIDSENIPNTILKKNIAHLTEENITEDFTKAFPENFGRK